MARLVVVSNRVPLPSERGAKAGGLAVALADALQPGSLWFGWSGRRSARGSGTTHIQRSEGVTYATIDLTEADYHVVLREFLQRRALAAAAFPARPGRFPVRRL